MKKNKSMKRNAATVAALGTLLIADAANAATLAGEVYNTTTPEQPTLVEPTIPNELPQIETPEEKEGVTEIESSDDGSTDKTEVETPEIQVPEQPVAEMIPEENLVLPTPTIPTVDTVEDEVGNENIQEIEPLANPGESADGQTLNISLENVTSIRRANLGTFVFGQDSILDITGQTGHTAPGAATNPGFQLATGTNAQPGMPNENSMAITDLATLPIVQGDSTWTVVHSANYNWYVVQVVSDTVGQIMSSSVTDPSTLTVTSNPGQGGLYAAPITGAGTASSPSNTVTGTQTGLRVWDQPLQSLPVGQYMIFGYPNSTVTTQVNTGGRIIFDFTVVGPTWENIDLSEATLTVVPGALRKTYDGTNAASRNTTNTEITQDARINIDVGGADTTLDFAFPVVDDVLTRFDFAGINANVEPTADDLIVVTDEYRTAPAYEIDYTADEATFLTHVENALAGMWGTEGPTPEEITTLAQMIWDASNNGDELYTGDIVPMKIEIDPGKLSKTFDNTLSMSVNDFTVQPRITNLPILNALLPSPSTQTFLIAPFTDENMNGLTFDEHIVGTTDFSAEEDDFKWEVELPATELVSNYMVDISGEYVPDLGEPAPVLLGLSGGFMPFDVTPVYTVPVTDLFSVEITKALGPELMFNNSLRTSGTITETTARVSDMIALNEEGANNQLWDINGVDLNIWSDEINVPGPTGIQYSLYTENPSLTRATPVALATNTTGNFTGLTPDTTYYVVAHSLESHNFLTGPTTQYEFTTGAENVPAPPTPETPADNITDPPTSDTTITGDNWQNLPSTGEAASMLGGIGGALLAGLGLYWLLKRRVK